MTEESKESVSFKAERLPEGSGGTGGAGTPYVLPEKRSFKKCYEHGMHSVQSSTIVAVGYFQGDYSDQADTGQDGLDLVVQFKTGAYIIEGVAKETFQAIYTADSVGRAYDLLIKKDETLGPLVKKLAE